MLLVTGKSTTGPPPEKILPTTMLQYGHETQTSTIMRPTYGSNPHKHSEGTKIAKRHLWDKIRSTAWGKSLATHSGGKSIVVSSPFRYFPVWTKIPFMPALIAPPTSSRTSSPIMTHSFGSHLNMKRNVCRTFCVFDANCSHSKTKTCCDVSADTEPINSEKKSPLRVCTQDSKQHICATIT